MLCRTAILLLIAIASETLADDPSVEASASLEQVTHDVQSGKTLLPAPVANGNSPSATAPAADLPPRSAGSGDVAGLGTDPSYNSDVVMADEAATFPSSEDARLLRRRSAPTRSTAQQPSQEASPGDAGALLASDAATTALAAMGIVVGLFLLCAWVFKRAIPKSSRILPREAAEILGRCPLGNKQFAQLLHVGNKVILVSVTANGAETLVEVDDPNEVARILGVCAASTPGSTSKEFDAIFQQFARETAPRGFLGEESESYSASVTYHQSGQGGQRG